MSYRLRTFGPPSLTDERGETPAGLGAGKSLAVLCYLAREGEVRRETIMALLWGEAPEERARNAFRQALHRLRSALGPEVLPHDPDTVRISAGADLRVDSDEFERALKEGRPADAVALVGGPFLEGFTTGELEFDHWVDGERARFRARFLAALRASAEGALAAGDAEAAVAYGRRLTREDPLDSAAALLEARSLTAAGRSSEAERLLADHAERYRAELGDDPPEDLAALLASLRSGGEPEGAEPPVAPSGVVLRPAALQALMAEWRSAAAGEGGAVLVAGEAGAGKSWLADELARRIRPTDQPVVLRGAERMGGHGLPYAPVAEALRGVLRARGLAGASTHLLAEAARLVPELRDRFDLPQTTTVSDDASRLRFFEGVASLVDAVAFEQPVLVILEGLHQSDARTIDLVHFMVSRLGDSAVLFVLTMEPGRTATALARRLAGRARGVSLDPVPPDALSAYLADRIPGLPDENRRRAAEAAGGSPSRAVAMAERLGRGEPLAAVPAVIDDMLRARAGSATPRERRILVALALIGRPLPLRLIPAVTHIPRGAVLESVEALRTAGLVRDRPDGAELTRSAVGDAALEQAGPAGAALLAGWAAEALAAERAAPDTDLATLYGRAGRPAEAARYAEAAARNAMSLAETELAETELRRALQWTGDAASRARLERMLAGLGAGPRALPGGAGGSGAGRWTRRGGRRTRLLVLVAAATVIGAIALVLTLEPPGVRPASAAGAAGQRVVRDTLVVVRTHPDGGTSRVGITGVPGAAEPTGRPLVLGAEARPRWLTAGAGGAGEPASFVLAPDGSRVLLVERGAAGGRLLSVSADRGDTTVLARGAGLRALGWAPDGSRVLYSAASRVGTGLWAVSSSGDRAPVALDTTARREIGAAAWSPDGVRVAWSGTSGGGPERDVFVAFSDGSGLRNVTGHPADDYHVAWAPSGDRVAFTSERDGNADIHAIELLSGRLWRLTWDLAHDDRAAFSPDGEFLAFESTRGGDAAVYIISSWGGQPVRVTDPGQRVEHAGWRGYPPPRLSHLRFRLPEPLAVGEVGQVVVEPVYDDYVSRNRQFVRWRALDPAIVAFSAERAGTTVPGAAVADTFLVGRSHGLARVVADAGGWRVDTAFVKVGPGPLLLSGAAAAELRGPWTTVGSEGEGLLSRASLPLNYGLEASVTVRVDRADGAGEWALGLAAPAARPGTSNGVGLMASIRWDPADGQLTFQVEREVHSEPVADRGGAPRRLGFVVDRQGRVSFMADDLVRWRSSLRITGAGVPLHRARVWLGGEAAAAGVAAGSLRVVIDPAPQGPGDN